MLTSRLLFGCRSLALEQTFLAGSLEAIITAGIGNQLAAVEMDDAINHRVEDMAIMADQNIRVRISL